MENNTVRTTRPEKCDIFVQRYQSQPITTKFQKHSLYFLTLQKSCQIFLSQNILHNVVNVVYSKTLSIRTDRTDKTVMTLNRLQFDQCLHCLSSYLFHQHIILQGKPKLFNFRIFSILISGVPIFRGFHLKNVC